MALGYYERPVRGGVAARSAARVPLLGDVLTALQHKIVVAAAGRGTDVPCWRV